MSCEFATFTESKTTLNIAPTLSIITPHIMRANSDCVSYCPLAYRWFCRLGLEDAVPHHSTFSVNRHGRFRDSDILRKVFEEAVCGCMAAGLVGGEGFAVDASVIEADASRFQRVEGAEVTWTDAQLSRRAIREYFAALESENSPLNPQQKPKAMSSARRAAARNGPAQIELPVVGVA